MKKQIDDPYSLNRFLSAQNNVYDSVRSELSAGKKEGHWMWFIFPQVDGLGSSDMAKYYSIHTKEEALAYLAHPVLGSRLKELTKIILGHDQRTIEEILGSIDSIKFRSSMTLFSELSEDDNIFCCALKKYLNGELDQITLKWLYQQA